MKKLTLTFVCFALSTAFVLAADYYLVRTQMMDGDYPKDGGPAPTVYVLLQPSNQPPVVFQKFDSWQMKSWLGLYARGSVVHYHASTFLLSSPTTAEWEAVQAFCKTNDITFKNESNM